MKKEQFAGFWIRVLASFIDGVVVGIPMGIVGFIIGMVFYTGSMTSVDTTYTTLYEPIDIVVLLLSLVVGVLYYGLMTSSKHQGTVGKMAVGIKVVGEDGGRITFGRSLGRYFATILSGFLNIGYLMVAFTEQKRGLHDFMAETYVVKKQGYEEAVAVANEQTGAVSVANEQVETKEEIE